MSEGRRRATVSPSPGAVSAEVSRIWAIRGGTRHGECWNAAPERRRLSVPRATSDFFYNIIISQKTTNDKKKATSLRETKSTAGQRKNIGKTAIFVITVGILRKHTLLSAFSSSAPNRSCEAITPRMPGEPRGGPPVEGRGESEEPLARDGRKVRGCHRRPASALTLAN